MANEYLSGFSLSDLMVPTKAATVYAAQESSLYLGGQLIPQVNVPAGSTILNSALMSKVTAVEITSEADSTSGVGDFGVLTPTDTAANISLKLAAARSVVRDFGGVDTNDIGRILGNSIAMAVDSSAATAMASLTAQELAGTGTTLDLDHIYTAIGTIRAAGESGPLTGILNAATYAELMAVIGTAAYAGGDFQTAAMRDGYMGKIGGVNFFVSANFNDTTTGVTDVKAAIFGSEALRMGVQGGVKLEMERRAAAVGVDIVASYAYGIGVIDATRGVLIKDAT